MSDFAVAWSLSRGRFHDSVKDLSQEQLNWRLHPGTLTLGESAVHVAGVEVWFVAQLKGEEVPADLARVARCATEGVVDDGPFPFSADELSPEFVRNVLERSAEFVRSTIENPGEEVLARQIRSALGPIIDGRGALARLAFHAGYHQGQAHLIATAPGFPTGPPRPQVH